MRRVVSSLLLIGTLVGAPGCLVAGRARIYDEPRRDYHRWDSREERAYREYLRETHRDYVEYKRLERREQEAYWAWRHDHPDRDRR